MMTAQEKAIFIRQDEARHRRMAVPINAPGAWVGMLYSHQDAARLKRLIKCMMRQALLSESEAISAIIAHRQGDGRWGGAEAVVHYGGATRIIRESVRHRGYWMHSIYGRWED